MTSALSGLDPWSKTVGRCRLAGQPRASQATVPQDWKIGRWEATRGWVRSPVAEPTTSKWESVAKGNGVRPGRSSMVIRIRQVVPVSEPWFGMLKLCWIYCIIRLESTGGTEVLIDSMVLVQYGTDTVRSVLLSVMGWSRGMLRGLRACGLAGLRFSSSPRPSPKEQLYAEGLIRYCTVTWSRYPRRHRTTHGVFRNPFWTSSRVQFGSLTVRTGLSPPWNYRTSFTGEKRYD
jgi:hypothetical protein